MSDERPAKPIDNLALRVFQRYYAELSRALSSGPEEVAADLYSAELVTMQERSQAVDPLGLTPFRKAEILMQAVERRIVTECSALPLRKFCRLLERRPGVGSIAARMKARFNYMEQHPQSLDDEWSSNTDCDQRLSSCAYQDQQPLENIPPAMKRHSQYLKELYKEREGMHLKWPQVIMKDYVNLLCIHKEKNLYQQHKELTKMLVLGQTDRIQKAQKSMAIGELADTKDGSRPKCVLVEGAPGSGKTMLSWEVSRKWGQDELFQQYLLVVMLPLRDPDVQNASSIEDLFPHDHKPFQQEVAEAVEQEAGKGVLFLLDGFDELPANQRKGSSLWMKLITGKLLRLATVMVTSRPWAFKTLLEPEHSPRISQHVEIVGFTDKNINEYIRKAFPDATDEYKFCQYLATYPHIRSTMYIPLNCAIVVEVYRSLGANYSAPKTVTQLYTALVRELLQRYMNSHPNGPTLSIAHRLASWFHWLNMVNIFEHVPSNVYQQLCTISKLAYHGLRNNQKLIFSDLPTNFETLGLLQRIPQLYKAGKGSASYNFLHLTVQEFLAAFHILLKRPRKQQRIIDGEVEFGHIIMEEEQISSDSDTNFPDDLICTEVEGGDEKKRSSGDVIRMFVAGLSGLKKCQISLPKRIENEDMTFLRILFESQNRPLLSNELRKEGIIIDISLYSPSLDDIYVLGYCISLSSCQWRLLLKGIGDEHMEMMKKAITSLECDKGRIIKATFGNNLTSDGLNHLLSLPRHTLSSLSDLYLYSEKLDSKSCDILAYHLSTLPNLNSLYLHDSRKIGCEGAQLLSQSVHTNTTLRKLSLCWSGIRNGGGCSLAKALRFNKHLKFLALYGNPLGEESIRQLIDSLQHNHTLKILVLPKQWSEFARCCDGYGDMKWSVEFV